jgi:predicted Zn-dependent protease
VDDGIRAWEAQFLYGEFQGTRITDSAMADVRVFFPGTPPPPAPLTDAPTASACSGVTNLVFGGNNQLTQPITVTLQSFGGFTPEQVANCLARVTTHEIGHTIGLLQHSDQATDIMFGAPFGLVQVRVPSPRDGATATRLYHTTSDIRP